MPRSTGPKTESGKSRSSLNAVKHGLLSSKWLSPEEQHSLALLIADLEAEYQPETATQRIMIERIAMSMTKLRRLHDLENAIYAKAQQDSEEQIRKRFVQYAGMDKELVKASAMPPVQQLTLLARYQTSLDRQISKAIGELMLIKSAAHEVIASSHSKSVQSIEDVSEDR